MSALAALYNVPTTENELAAWASAHMTHHRDLQRVIYEITGGNMPEFILDPIDPNNTGIWEDQHQAMHNNMDAVLGIAGFDLTGVDFKDTGLLTGWIQLNNAEHYAAANILGIG